MSSYDWAAAEKYLRKISRKIPKIDRVNIREALRGRNAYFVGRIVEDAAQNAESLVHEHLIDGFDRFAGKA